MVPWLLDFFLMLLLVYLAFWSVSEPAPSWIPHTCSSAWSSGFDPLNWQAVLMLCPSLLAGRVQSPSLPSCWLRPLLSSCRIISAVLVCSLSSGSAFLPWFKYSALSSHSTALLVSVNLEHLPLFYQVSGLCCALKDTWPRRILTLLPFHIKKIHIGDREREENRSIRGSILKWWFENCQWIYVMNHHLIKKLELL